jgi:hypothetical protein
VIRIEVLHGPKGVRPEFVETLSVEYIYIGLCLSGRQFTKCLKNNIFQERILTSGFIKWLHVQFGLDSSAKIQATILHVRAGQNQ